MEKKGDNRQNFDASQVKINPAIMEELDNAHKILDQIISNTQQTLERNQAFLIEFEKTYENAQPDPTLNGGITKEVKRLDPLIVSKIVTLT